MVFVNDSTCVTSRNQQRKLFIYVLAIVSLSCAVWLILPQKQLFHFNLGLADVPETSIKENTIVLQQVFRLQDALERYNVSEDIHSQIIEIISSLGGRSSGAKTVNATSLDNSSDFLSLSAPVEIVESNITSTSSSLNITDSFNATLKQLVVNSTNNSVFEVCPEVWLGTGGDYPFFYQGWRQVNCTNVLPFKEVLTVILNFFTEDNETCPPSVQRVITGLRNLYPTVPVIVGGVSNACVPTNASLLLHVVDLPRNVSTSGGIWNQLFKLAKTPYILVGRELDDFIWTANLEREVRMLSYNRSLSVAGGSVRNLTGHWWVGCYQSFMRNYILEYLEGYYASRNECMYCDHLAGPFVTRTKLVQTIPFDESLSDIVLFEDWFWRIRKASHVVINCPDVMYSASNKEAALMRENHTSWLPLIQKWELNRIVLPSGQVFSYTCAEAGISCAGVASNTRSFLMPICCLEQYASAFKIFHEFCLKHNVRYELDSGSALGAVKMNGLMPWDIDADNTFYTSNYSLFKSNQEHFKKHGIKLTSFSKKKDDSYFGLYTPDISVEMWGQLELSTDNETYGEPFSLIPTLVPYHGYWVYAPHNPAIYSRGRYGHEILKHAHSWRHLGMKKSQDVYKPGKFNKCQKPGHHACLDQFSADGNLQFRVPN